MVKVFHRWFLRFSFFLAIAAIALNFDARTGLAQIDDDLSSYQPPTITCNDTSFFWNGAHYKIGRVIGSGLYGTVFDLLKDGTDPGDYVLKILTESDAEAVYRHALDEVKLYESLPASFIPTYYRSVFRLRNARKNSRYGAFLIKPKITGYTLFGILGAPYFLRSFPEAYKNFLSFKRTLSNELISLAKKDVFVWDLHANNIMYDILRRNWKVVDAERVVTFSEFQREISTRAQYAPPKHAIHAINDLLDEDKELSREDIAREIVSIYLDHIQIRFTGMMKKAG